MPDIFDTIKTDIFDTVEQSFGLRLDGTPKGQGFFGELELPGGGVATEFSIGVEFDGKETQIPTLVPTLTEDELGLLINDIIPNRKEIPETIIQKAIEHAKLRISQGQSPFKEDEVEPEVFDIPRFDAPEIADPQGLPLIDVPIELPEQPVDVFDEVETQQIGIIERGFKQFINKFFIEPARTFLTEGGPGKFNAAMKLAESGDLPKPTTGPRKFSLRELGAAIRESNKLGAKIKKEQREAIKEVIPGFEVPVAETIPEKVVDVTAGVTAFIGRLAVTRKFLGIRRGDFAGSVATWEVENIATGGTPGTGAAMRLALGGIDVIPATTMIGKTLKLGAESSLFGGLTAAAGGDFEDVAISAMIPLGFKAWNAASRGVAKGRAERAIKNLRTEGKKYGLNLDKVPDQALDSIIEAGKQASFWNKQHTKGKVTDQVYDQRLSEIRNKIKPIFEAIGKQQPIKPPSAPAAAAEPTPTVKPTVIPTKVTEKPEITPPAKAVKPEIARKPLPKQEVTAKNLQEVKIQTLAKELEKSLKLSPERALRVAEKKLALEEKKTKERRLPIPTEPKELNAFKLGMRAAFKLKDGSVVETGFIHALPKNIKESDIAELGFTRPDTKEFLTRKEADALTGIDEGIELQQFSEKAADLPVKELPENAAELVAGGEVSKPIEVQPPTKPTVDKITEIAPKVTPPVEVTDKELMTERQDIKQIPQAKRKPQEIQRLNAIEDELIERHADEFPEIDISPKTRRAETKKVKDQIVRDGIYQAELDAAADLPDLSGTFSLSAADMGEVQSRFEGRQDILKKFKVQEKADIGKRWDEAAAEIGIERFDEFLDMVELFVEAGKAAKGEINETALAQALNSGESAIELFALKHDMLKQGFTAAEINKEIEEFAKRERIDRKDIIPDLISLKEIKDVEKKQTILRELDKTFRKVAKKEAPGQEQAAIAKAQLKAGKTKRPVFVFERAGRFVVATAKPRRGEFTRITPPAAGEITGKVEKLQAGPTPQQQKEAKLLIQRINIIQKKKGLTQKEFSDLKMEHGGSRRLTGARPRNIEQLKAVLKAIEKARPKIIGHKKVVSLKTEKQIAELRTVLTDLGFMNDAEFGKILDIEARGKEAKFTSATNFITQKQGNEILARMHDTAQRLRVTEPIRRAIEKNPTIKAEIAKIDKLPTKAKDPSRLKSMRFFFQRLGEQARQPIYEVFLDLTLEEQLRSRERHKSMKLAEKLPEFARIANSPEAMQRIEDWIVSQSTLVGKPKSPKDITENELRLAKLIQASFESYETLARAGKFFEFFDNRQEMPQYLQFKKGIDKAFDVYNTKGYEALIKYLDTQDWGIVRAGYSPMESVVKKVSTHRMPDIAVGKSRIRVRGIQYRKQDRDILQRWYSYMRQMDQLVHIQPRIKSLVRLVNDNQGSFVNAQRINNVVSTYLDNLKHTNYEDGLIEEWSRRLYSQAITVRVLADPVKVFRNLAQNAAFSEDRRDFLDPRNKKLTAEDMEYLETHVQQSSVMMTDWAFVGEDPILFKNLTKWVQRKTLYPSSDRVNRLLSFYAKINRVRRAFASDKPLARKMKDARFSDMQKSEQRAALGILAKDGIDAMARYVAKVHTDNTHFLYAREQRSPAEQTKLGRIALNLALFRRAALEKALFQLAKIFQRGTGFGPKRRAAFVLATLLGMSALVGVLWKRLTGQKYSPYSYFSFLELNFGGLELATIQKAEDVYNNTLDIFTIDPKGRGKAIEALGTSIANSADYMIPFYDIGLRAIEATIGSENIDRIPARKLREMIDKEYTSRGLRQVERSLIEKIQFTFAKGGGRKQVTKKEGIKFQFRK